MLAILFVGAFLLLVLREGAAACIAFTGSLPAADACRMSAAAFLGLASIVEGIQAAAASEGTLTFSWVLVFLSVSAFFDPGGVVPGLLLLVSGILWACSGTSDQYVVCFVDTSQPSWCACL